MAGTERADRQRMRESTILLSNLLAFCLFRSVSSYHADFADITVEEPVSWKSDTGYQHDIVPVTHR
jgi:hypothetical protein